MRRSWLIVAILFLLSAIAEAAYSEDPPFVRPFITGVYTADPSAHVFEGRVYVYPSHDQDDAGFFDMEDYHVFSSADLLNWVDHGSVLNYKDVDWVRRDGGSEKKKWEQSEDHPRFWAPDCAYKDGTYYLYYPAHDKDQTDRDAEDYFKIGVATSKSPCGPFKPATYTVGGKEVESYIPGSYSVDPCVFDDGDGNFFMFFGGCGFGGIKDAKPRYVKLAANMKEFDADFGPPRSIDVPNWFEGSWVHKRKDPKTGETWYYLSYCSGVDGYIRYARISSLTDEDARWEWLPGDDNVVIDKTSSYTNHHSFVQFGNDDSWYAFFHNAELAGGPSAKDLNRRSICVAKLEYTEDGWMKKVVQDSMQAVSAYSRIKAALCDDKKGVDLTKDCGDVEKDVGKVDIGKRVSNIANDAYIKFKEVDFGETGAVGFRALVACEKDGGCLIEVRKDSETGLLLGSAKVASTGNLSAWRTVEGRFDKIVKGNLGICLVFKGSDQKLDVDWFSFDRAYKTPVGNVVSLKSLNENLGAANALSVGRVMVYDDDQCLATHEFAEGDFRFKFNMLDYPFEGWGKNLDCLMLNSAYNGDNLSFDVENKPISALPDSNYAHHYINNLVLWGANEDDDGTVSMKSVINMGLFCVDTQKGGQPPKVYANRSGLPGQWEKYYCEVSDAPIGCVVAFKSQSDKLNGKNYLCIDRDQGYALCANRAAVGGAWEKFLVVDAGNGYVALRTLNTADGKGEKYLYFNGPDSPGKADLDDAGIAKLDQDAWRFQWRNNGDGTVSLFNVKLVDESGNEPSGRYLCVDTQKGGDTPKVYANRQSVWSGGISWEKFYCQVIGSERILSDGNGSHRLKSVFNGGRMLTKASGTGSPVKCQDYHPEWDSQDWSMTVVPGQGSKDLVLLSCGSQYLTVDSTADGAAVKAAPKITDATKIKQQQWYVLTNTSGTIRLRNAYSNKYLTVASQDDYSDIKSQEGHPEWNSQDWYVKEVYPKN